ncbi:MULTISPECIES: YceD family protein [Myroides]|uniref:DUF177 domain-containing protein n=1 Tax=Myroides albus TaxID=2562892 RepID=A0A6I3LL59_9FLAO|nr:MULTISPECIES: DUF177 domain-containing protein [Myroides]MTG96725.1 DUF177 domain-containing protein [Myroides albus]MVX35633.1 DUF177 domain-containing protein [Myroides sp. LoEW2-1]UVD80863.1 DUF177 domain-containing protein [Myroides albus]
MKVENKFLIPFTGLKNGEHKFEIQVDNSFFDNYDYNDFNTIDAQITVLLNKKTTLLELHFESNGIANVPCDVTNQDFDLPINNELNLVVKFGDEFNNDHDELLIVPFTEHQIDIAQYVYEMIVLSIPQKRVHPGVLDGTLESEALDILGYYNEDDLDLDFDDELDFLELEDDFDDQEDEDIDDQENNNEEIDPRWAELKKLLTDK